jgi:hypothetical protein
VRHSGRLGKKRREPEKLIQNSLAVRSDTERSPAPKLLQQHRGRALLQGPAALEPTFDGDSAPVIRARTVGGEVFVPRHTRSIAVGVISRRQPQLRTCGQ